jgi:hypothetical protein
MPESVMSCTKDGQATIAGAATAPSVSFSEGREGTVCSGFGFDVVSDRVTCSVGVNFDCTKSASITLEAGDINCSQTNPTYTLGMPVFSGSGTLMFTSTGTDDFSAKFELVVQPSSPYPGGSCVGDCSEIDISGTFDQTCQSGYVCVENPGD